jgi:hypothetical protein
MQLYIQTRAGALPTLNPENLSYTVQNPAVLTAEQAQAAAQDLMDLKATQARRVLLRLVQLQQEQQVHLHPSLMSELLTPQYSISLSLPETTGLTGRRHQALTSIKTA